MNRRVFARNGLRQPSGPYIRELQEKGHLYRRPKNDPDRCNSLNRSIVM
jgi:hypothetical protein